MTSLHHHRYLQHAPTNRSHCVKCNTFINKGQLRVGTSFVPRGQRDNERVWVTWVHAKCFTQTRAKNLIQLAKREGTDVKHYLVVPPSVHAGGSGPESGNVGKFARFLAALDDGDETASRALMRQLEEHFHDFPEKTLAALTEKQAAYANDVMDWSYLDRQLREDTTIVDHMCKGDLLAVCAHQEGRRHATADDSTTVPELKRRILAYLKGHADATATANDDTKPSGAAAAAADSVSTSTSEGGGGGGAKVAAPAAAGDAEEDPTLQHHFLQHAPSGRSSCAHCNDLIPQGQVRIGRPFKPPSQLWQAGEHSWVSWEHVRCLSTDQARHLVAHAQKEGKELSHYLVVPPSVHTGGSGPEGSTIGKVLRFVEARAAGDAAKAAALLEQIEAVVHTFPAQVPVQLSSAQQAYSLDPKLMQWSFLDRQLAEDALIVEHLTKGDLLSLYAHLAPTRAGKTSYSVAGLRREVLAIIARAKEEKDGNNPKRARAGGADGDDE